MIGARLLPMLVAGNIGLAGVGVAGVVVPAPFGNQTGHVYLPGSVIARSFVPGSEASRTFSPGSEAGNWSE